MPGRGRAALRRLGLGSSRHGSFGILKDLLPNG
jgi:hypothetical protein